jgi:hypothetical protein
MSGFDGELFPMNPGEWQELMLGKDEYQRFWGA